MDPAKSIPAARALLPGEGRGEGAPRFNCWGSQALSSHLAKKGSDAEMFRHRVIFRAGRTPWAVLLFFASFAILISFVAFYYLMPAMDAAIDATPKQRRGLAAYAWLLMSLVLLVLFVGLMMTFRIGRFFFPRSTPPPSKTKYVDAWAESGKRLAVPEPDQNTEP